MKNTRLFGLLLIAILLATCLLLSLRNQGGASDVQGKTFLWPSIEGHAGVYGLTSAQEIEAMAAEGLDLLVTTTAPGTKLPSFIDAVSRMGTKVIDYSFATYIYKVCFPQVEAQRAAGIIPACDFSEENKRILLEKTSERLAQTKNDPSVVGYWILDDYPYADLREELRAVRALVAEANATALFPRPTVCGFGGTLDWKREASDAEYDTAFRTYVDDSVTNYDPLACDMVALYYYGASLVNDPATVDWSMTSLLPYAFGKLEEKGWDRTKQPLIGFAHTFDYGFTATAGRNYVTPRASDIALMTSAYCQNGATAILAYAWNDGATNMHGLGNTPAFRQGLSQGIESCKARWEASSVLARTNISPVPSPTPIPDPSPSLSASAAPSPSATPRPVPNPEPMATATPAAEPSPSPAPIPEPPPQAAPPANTAAPSNPSPEPIPSPSAFTAPKYPEYFLLDETGTSTRKRPLDALGYALISLGIAVGGWTLWRLARD